MVEVEYIRNQEVRNNLNHTFTKDIVAYKETKSHTIVSEVQIQFKDNENYIAFNENNEDIKASDIQNELDSKKFAKIFKEFINIDEILFINLEFKDVDKTIINYYLAEDGRKLQRHFDYFLLSTWGPIKWLQVRYW